METLGFILWETFYTLFWRWPFYYISWLAVLVVAMSARTEYVKKGSGLRGFAHALWYALKLMPSTMNHIFRWIAQQAVLIASIAAKRDIMSDLPKPVLRWLGQTLVETQIIERPVYRDRYKKVPRWWRVARVILSAFCGAAILRTYDYWDIVWPWVRTWF